MRYVPAGRWPFLHFVGGGILLEAARHGEESLPDMGWMRPVDHNCGIAPIFQDVLELKLVKRYNEPKGRAKMEDKSWELLS